MTTKKTVPLKDKRVYRLDGFVMLVVEDSLATQTLLSSMLRSFGVGEVLVCSGGTEAQEILTITQNEKKSNNIRGVDIVLSDWFMPGGSGLDLLNWVRGHEDDDIRFLPFILVSAYTTEKVITAARDHGAHEALVKPLTGDKLAQRILSVVDWPRPFIKSDDYFGPDRRRKVDPYFGDERRKMDSTKLKVIYER